MTEPTNFSPRSWALLLSLVVTAAGAALSGCSHDDYYCDNTGCYYCDGVGCRAATPPTRATCHGDYDCASGQVCTSSGCATGCRVDSDCAQGWVCRGGSADGGTSAGLCVAPTETTPTPTPGSCQSNADCPNGLVCLDGVCHRSTIPTCTADTQCTNGNVCVAGRCTPPANTCQFNNQCGVGRVCIDSQCQQSCGNATDPACPSGESCISAGGTSYCAPSQTSSCANDSACGTGQHCLSGTCYAACTPGAASCADGLYCSDDGVCVPDTRPRPFCDAAHPCVNGSTCVDGVCRRTCGNNNDCLSTDVTYRNCAVLPDTTTNTQTYCLTDHEFHPMCARQSDCTQGQNCIDAICR